MDVKGVLILFTFAYFCQSQVLLPRNLPSYTVIAPYKIRPHMTYHVSATVHDAPAPVEFIIQIVGFTERREPVNIMKDIHVDPKTTEIVDFAITDWKPGNYSLEVTGRGGMSFRNSTQLLFEHKSYSVFIQTDRPVYKPSQLVQIRVAVVDPYLLPVTQPSVIDLSVRDAQGNLVEEWKSLRTFSGVASTAVQLAGSPLFGDWNVHVDIEGEKVNKSFTVAQFILPTFEVSIELPSFATYNKSDVVVRVKAMYSFGKPVRGEVTLTVAPRTRYNKLTVRPYESFQTKTQIDGAVDIYMNLLHDLSLQTDFFKREIEFFALVQEEESGHKYNSTNTMWIYDKEIKVELIKTSETFKPGLKYTAFLKVSKQNGMPVLDVNDKLELKYGFSLREDEWKTATYVVPRNGLIKLEFTPPNEEDVMFLNMRANFLGQTYYIDRIDAAVSPSNNFIQAVLLTPNPKVLHTIEMEVNATEPLNHLVYKVIGRGNVLVARTIPVPNQKVYRFSFRVPNEMAPRARVLVYYIRSTNSEIVADSVTFDVEGLFLTTVTVDTNVKEVLPGRQVSIRLQTKPNAFVAVLGVDKGILELKSGNDISSSDVIKDLEIYNGGFEAKYIPPWYRRRRKRSLWWPGSKSAGLIFEDSGMVVLTNALLLNVGREASYPDNVIYIDENAANAPIQPPSEIPGAIVDQGPLIIRKQYPETWLWMNTTTGNDGIATVTHTVPDSLASFVISAFAVHPSDGLGISSLPSQLTVYRPFFITMSLPHVVLLGEQLAIQVVVFNYNEKSIQAEVAMENRKNEFEFTVAGKDPSDIRYLKRRIKIVNVPPSEGVPVSFLVIPLKVGYIDIRVSASSSLAGDSLTKKLLVKADGSTQHFNKVFFIDSRDSGAAFKVNVSTIIPRNSIQYSGKITASAVGDLMGFSLQNLNNLLFLPTGCGEPNLVTFVPNIIALKYLSKVNKLTQAFKNRAVGALKTAYQQQLTYKRKDGSFSTFGDRDRSGSTWLTAYAMKSLLEARTYIVIDPDVITQGLEWIVQKQNSDGSFDEPGEVHHKALQGGIGNGVALTSFVVMTLMESEFRDKYNQQILLAERFIEREISSSDNPYVVAIGTYALHLLDSPAKERAFQMLLNLAEKEDNVMFWNNKENAVNTTDKQSDYFFLAPSLDIEATSYGLLTLAHRFDTSSGIPVLRWLIMKQNQVGGFSSSQDTVVALRAISHMAPLVSSLSTELSIKLKYLSDQKVIRISNTDSVTVQEIELPTDVQFVEMEASGIGTGIMQISWQFNLAVSGETPAFYLNPLLDKTSTASYLQLSICSYQQEIKEDRSNMAVMEVGLPSGYVADVDALPSILQIPKVKRVETQKEDTEIVIYLDRLDRQESCVTVSAHRIHKVAHQKRAPVRVYDYYNQAQSARVFYRPHKTVLCDICDDNDCGSDCTIFNNRVDLPLEGSGKQAWTANWFLILSLITLTVFT